MTAFPHNKNGPRSIRVRIIQMGYWGQKMAIGLPVGFVTLVIFGLTAVIFSLTAACFASGVVAYTGIVFGWAWIDKRMYFLSSRDTRPLPAIALIHSCFVGALAAIIYLLTKNRSCGRATEPVRLFLVVARGVCRNNCRNVRGNILACRRKTGKTKLGRELTTIALPPQRSQPAPDRTSSERQSGRFGKRCKISVGPCFWRREFRVRPQSEANLDTRWFFHENYGSGFDPAIV